MLLGFPAALQHNLKPSSGTEMPEATSFAAKRSKLEAQTNELRRLKKNAAAKLSEVANKLLNCGLPREQAL